MKAKFNPVDALKEHLLSGNRITILEAQSLFGVQDPIREMTRLRRNGFLVKRQTVPLARVIRRMNQFCTFIPPKKLPVIEINITEWWIQVD